VKYSGDSPSKKIARLVVWKRIKELLGARFFTEPHVVLLSAEAGDVATLLGMGVVPQHIIGVDEDHHAIAAAQNKYPDIRYKTGDVAWAVQVLKRGGAVPASVFLDFCAPLRDSTVNKAIEVASHLGTRSVLALAVKMGRENGDWGASVAVEKAKVSTGSRTFYLRTELLTRALLTRAKGHRYRLRPTDFYRYSSRKTTDQSSEMLVCIAQVSSGSELKKHIPRSVTRIVRAAEYRSIVADYRSIGSLASLLAERGEDAHLLLNLKKESIPPYKAHRTRGTYVNTATSVTRSRRAN